MVYDVYPAAMLALGFFLLRTFHHLSVMALIFILLNTGVC